MGLIALFVLWKMDVLRSFDPRWCCPICKKLDFKRNLVEVADYGEDSHYEHPRCQGRLVTVDDDAYDMICAKAEVRTLTILWTH
jgi:hypothetical protein